MSLRRKRFMRRVVRAERVHSKVRAVSDVPRLSIFKSLKHFYAQIIDDATGTTLASCSTKMLSLTQGAKKDRAKAVGIELAKQAHGKGISKVAFDRGRFLYHGRVQSFAEGAREGGLVF